MKRQRAVQTQKKTLPSHLRKLLPHSDVRAANVNEMPSNVSAETSFDHNFSRVAVRPSTPGFGQDNSNVACPLLPQRCPFGGVCHTCPPRVQAKLKIGQSGDKYEQEADRVADEVMRIPEPTLQRKTCTPCNENDEEEQIQAKPISGRITSFFQRQVEGEILRTKEVSRQTPGIRWNAQMNINNLIDKGKPLSASERALFEPRFGYDFSQVRVHNGGKATRLTRAMKARAFTLGQDVVFGAGQYAPETKVGQRLLSHELTHVLQQQRSGLMLNRYTETTEPNSRFWQGVAEFAEGPVLRGVRGYICLQQVMSPMHDLTFNHWIPGKCTAQGGQGPLHARDWDAFGHCWVACEGSRRCGNAAAQDLGTAREVLRELGYGGPHDSFTQDVANQARGRELAYSRGRCYTLCDNAYQGGQLDLSAPQRTCVDCSNLNSGESAANCSVP